VRKRTLATRRPPRQPPPVDAPQIIVEIDPDAEPLDPVHLDAALADLILAMVEQENKGDDEPK
jgi:hypothetical protein